jgi:hypothetical protein
MYYPFFRGKQYELITIRETAELMASSRFVPIIEPVREQTTALTKTLESLCDQEADAIVIVNPQSGDHSDDGSELVTLIKKRFGSNGNLIIGLMLTDAMSAEEVIDACSQHAGRRIALVHSGFADAKTLGPRLNEHANVSTSIFFEAYCGKLYRRHFRQHTIKVLVRDGFERRRNRDHPDAAEFFSDLHVTFEEENMDGFGDFLIVGDEYLEGGRPAYTIAIHLTYIDSDRDDEMHIRHFKSDRQDTPKDPAGKFAEALSKLINVIDARNSQFVETSAIREFRDLHARRHYPGLGYVKKLSMKHHIETLAAYFEANATD